MKNNMLFRTCVFGGYNKNDVDEYIKEIENEMEKLKNISNTTADDLNKEEHNDFEYGKNTKFKDDVLVFGLDNNKEIIENTEKENSSDDQINLLQKEVTEKNKTIDLLTIQLMEKNNEIEQLKQISKEEKESNTITKNIELEKEVVELREEKRKYEDDYKAIKSVLLNARVDAEIIIAKANEKAKAVLEEANKSVLIKKQEALNLTLKCLEDNCNSLLLAQKEMEEQIKGIENTKSKMKELEVNINKELKKGEN